MAQDRVAAVAGVGPGIGRCAQLRLRCWRRSFGQGLLRSIATQMGKIDTPLFNAGTGVFADVENITAEQFEASWRVDTLGAFQCSRQVIPAIKAASSSSVPPRLGAGGRSYCRIRTRQSGAARLAESMARSLWPSGIYVARAYYRRRRGRSRDHSRKNAGQARRLLR
jgi:hypothetical protein